MKPQSTTVNEVATLHSYKGTQSVRPDCNQTTMRIHNGVRNSSTQTTAIRHECG